MRVWYKDVIWSVMYSVHTGRLTGEIQYVCAGVISPDNPSVRVHMQVTYMIFTADCKPIDKIRRHDIYVISLDFVVQFMSKVFVVGYVP